MKYIVWNAQGLGSPHAFWYLQRLIAEFSPDLLFVSESKVPSSVGDKWRMLLNFDYFFGVDPCGRSGGLMLFWLNNINLYLGSYSSGHIDCCISGSDFNWYFTSFYGNPASNLCVNSWELICKISSPHGSGDSGWLVGGDFNEGVPKSNGCLADFRDVVSDLGLFDLNSVGPKFTWTNKRSGDDLILERLDKFLANQGWLDNFPNVEVRNLNFFWLWSLTGAVGSQRVG
ncbi:hypothetical protein ACS0TY_011686 [Phlomoides rotata]